MPTPPSSAGPPPVRSRRSPSSPSPGACRSRRRPRRSARPGSSRSAASCARATTTARSTTPATRATWSSRTRSAATRPPGSGRCSSASACRSAWARRTASRSDGRAVTFERRPEYAAALQARFPAPAGQQWEGYVSSPKTYAPDSGPADAGDRARVHAPAGADGAPFAGPLRWRMVVGFRQLGDAAEAGTPADCTATTGATACVDAPQEAAVPVDLIAPVSDFGVLDAPAATARAGTTATLAFPVAFRDDAALGALDVALAAATDVPGAVAAPAAPPSGWRRATAPSPCPSRFPRPRRPARTPSRSPLGRRARRDARRARDARRDRGRDGRRRGRHRGPGGRLPGRAARALRHGPRRLRRALRADPGRDERHLARRGEGRRARLDEAQGAAARCARAPARRGPPDAHGPSRTLAVKRLRDVLLRRGKGFSAPRDRAGPDPGGAARCECGRTATRRATSSGSRATRSTARAAASRGAAAPARTCDWTPPAGP